MCAARHDRRTTARCRRRDRRILYAHQLWHGFGQGKETRNIDGVDYVFEKPIHGDFALVLAEKGDRWGNLIYRKAARNFGPVMCMAAKTTIVQVKQKVELGQLDPETIITPGIFVNRIVEVANPAISS